MKGSTGWPCAKGPNSRWEEDVVVVVAVVVVLVVDVPVPEPALGLRRGEVIPGWPPYAGPLPYVRNTYTHARMQRRETHR